MSLSLSLLSCLKQGAVCQGRPLASFLMQGTPPTDYAFLQYGALGLLAVVILVCLGGAGWYVRHMVQEQAKTAIAEREERARFLEILTEYSQAMVALRESIAAHDERMREMCRSHEDRAGARFQRLLEDHTEVKTELRGLAREDLGRR